jgi:hypothetical protein
LQPCQSLCSQNQIDIFPVEVHEESNILEVVVASKFSHEHPKPYILDERCEDSHLFVFSDCSFSGFLFQDHVCEEQYEVFDEMHEQGSLGIHHSYVSPAHQTLRREL